MVKIDVKVEFAKNNDEFKVYKAGTTTVVDTGRLGPDGSRRDAKMKKYSMTKQDVCKLLSVQSSFVDNHVLSNVRYFVVPWRKTYVDRANFIKWINASFIPFKRTHQLLRSDVTNEEFADIARIINDVKSGEGSVYDRLFEYVEEKHEEGRLRYYTPLKAEIELDRLRNFPLERVDGIKYWDQVKSDEVPTTLRGMQHRFSKTPQVSLQYLRRQAMLKGSIEWKFGNTPKAKTMYQMDRPHETLYNALEQTVPELKMKLIGEYAFVCPYVDYIKYK